MSDFNYSNFEQFKIEADEIHWFNEKEKEIALNFNKTPLSKNNTKVVATISSKTDKAQVIELITSGIRLYNIKCALFKIEDYTEIIKRINKEFYNLKERPTFMFNLQGPIPVVSSIFKYSKKVKSNFYEIGNIVKIINKDSPIMDNENTIVIDKKIYNFINIGDVIVFDNKVTLKVISKEPFKFDKEMKKSDVIRPKMISQKILKSQNNIAVSGSCDLINKNNFFKQNVHSFNQFYSFNNNNLKDIFNNQNNNDMLLQVKESDETDDLYQMLNNNPPQNITQGHNVNKTGDVNSDLLKFNCNENKCLSIENISNIKSSKKDDQNSHLKENDIISLKKEKFDNKNKESIKNSNVLIKNSIGQNKNINQDKKDLIYKDELIDFNLEKTKNDKKEGDQVDLKIIKRNSKNNDSPMVLIDVDEKENYNLKKEQLNNDYKELIGLNSIENNSNSIKKNYNDKIKSDPNNKFDSNFMIFKNSKNKITEDFRMFTIQEEKENTRTKSKLEMRKNKLKNNHINHVFQSNNNTDNNTDKVNQDCFRISSGKFTKDQAKEKPNQTSDRNVNGNLNLNGNRSSFNKKNENQNSFKLSPNKLNDEDFTNYFANTINLENQDKILDIDNFKELNIKVRHRLIKNGFVFKKIKSNSKENLYSLDQQNKTNNKVLVCEVTYPGEINIQAELNIVDKDITECKDIKLFGAKEISDMNKAISLNINIFCVNANSAEDILEIRNTLHQDDKNYFGMINCDENDKSCFLNNKLKIFAKIYTNNSIKNFDEILLESDGIILNPLFISNTYSFENLCTIEEYISKECKKSHKPLYIESSRIETLKHNTIPSLSEISSFSSCIESGIDGFIISDNFPKDSYKRLQQIISDIENIKETVPNFNELSRIKYDHEDKLHSFLMDNVRLSRPSIIENMFYSITRLTYEIGISCIILFTDSLYITKKMSLFTPNSRIIVPTNSLNEYNFLRLFKGVSSILVDNNEIIYTNESVLNE